MKNEKEYIIRFMTRTFEKSVDCYMLADKNYVIPRQKIHEYVKSALSIPYIEYIEYIKNEEGIIEDSQLTQSSSFMACSSEMCKVLELQGNPGLSFVEIGQLFPQYVRVKNEAAFRKYGENQVKTSAQLGLTFEYYGSWYLSCIGYIFNELDEQQRDSLLARTILRVPLYHHIMIRLLKEIVDLSDYMVSLSNSTKGRRIGSILKMINICLAECRRENIKYNDLFYPTYAAHTKTLKINRQIGTMQIEEPSIEFSTHHETKQNIRNNVSAKLVPPDSIIRDIMDDNEVRVLIHNMMELYDGTSILNIVAECQKEFQDKYYNMERKDWIHLVGKYVRMILNQPSIKEDEKIKLYGAG